MKIMELRNEEEWLKLRKEVVTATEIPILLGLNKWSSPAKMLKEKQDSTFTGNAFTRIGQLLEPVVVEVVNEVLHEKFALLEKDGVKIMYVHSNLPIGATPDACNGEMFLECKTTKPFNYLKYRNCPPEYYIMQLIVQLYCANMKVGYLAIMSTNLSQETADLNYPISIFKVVKNEKLCSLMEAEVSRFFRLTKEGKMYRVNTTTKLKARLLIQISIIQVI